MANRNMQHKAMVGRQRMRRAYLKPYTMPRYIVPNADTLAEYQHRVNSMKRGELARSLRISPERQAVIDLAEKILEGIDPDRCITMGTLKYFFNANYTKNVFVDERLRYSLNYTSRTRAMQAFELKRITWWGELTSKGDTPP